MTLLYTTPETRKSALLANYLQKRPFYPVWVAWDGPAEYLVAISKSNYGEAYFTESFRKEAALVRGVHHLFASAEICQKDDVSIDTRVNHLFMFIEVFVCNNGISLSVPEPIHLMNCGTTRS